MKINKITFTGADNNTDIKELQKIQNDYPFVEWGILISTNQDRNRYPSNEFISSLKDSNLNVALHLCGKCSGNIMKDGILDIKFDFFNRYQINFNFKYTKHDIENFNRLTNKHTNKKFILQFNKSNESYIYDIINKFDTSNTNILYDASGGRGTEIADIKPPFDNIYTGYSGGLNPDNVSNICKLISEHENTSEVWIDMESGVRTDDVFDLNKVISVIKKIQNYCK